MTAPATLTTALRRVPPHLRGGLEAYILHGWPVGGYLEAVISNDLVDACRRADPISAMALYDVCMLLVEYAPAVAWGSREKYAAWVQRRGSVPVFLP